MPEEVRLYVCFGRQCSVVICSWNLPCRLLFCINI